MGFFFLSKEFSLETSLDFETAVECLDQYVERRAPWWGMFRSAPPAFHGRVLDGGGFELFPNKTMQPRTMLVLRGKLEATADGARAVGRIELRQDAKWAMAIPLVLMPLLALGVSARSMQAGAGWAALTPVLLLGSVVAILPLMTRAEARRTVRRLARVLQATET